MLLAYGRLMKRQALSQYLPRSIAAEAALALSMLIGSLFVVAGYLSYSDAREQSISSAVDRLDAYNREIVQQQEDRFLRLQAMHRHATELLFAELGSGDNAERREAFEAMVPRIGDGTRRTAPQLFEGAETPVGFIRGIGGFVGTEPDEGRKSLLTAAIKVLHTIGEGSRADMKNLSFFTPDNTLIMFAPDRPDKLLFYRHDAGPDLDFRKSEFVKVTLPAENPSRKTRCTSLQPILYDKRKQTWTTGCHTPIDVGGVQLGAWGNSLLLDDILATSHFEDHPGTSVILVSGEGRLIRHPLYTRQGMAATGRYLDLKSATEPQLRALWDTLAQHKFGAFLGYSSELDAYVSIRRVPTAGWFAVTVQPADYVEAPARRSLYRVVMTAIVCLALQAAMLFFFLRRKVGRPLRALMHEANDLTARVARRATDRADQVKDDEVGVLTAHFRTMARQILSAHSTLEHRVAERTRQLELANFRLRDLVERDPLTGLFNRRKLLEILEDQVHQAKRNGKSFLMIFDVDNFKRVNDTHGHPAGDLVLREIGQRILERLRPCDIAARLGGDEFAIILRQLERQEHATMIAEEIIRSVSQAIMLREGEVIVGTSIGIAAFDDEVRTPKEMMVRADLALAEAKRAGKGCQKLFNQDVQELAASKNAMAERLDEAFIRNQMKVYLQPILSLETGAVEFAESLIRWEDGRTDPITASEFIDVIEEFQMAPRLERALFTQVFRIMGEWKRDGIVFPIVTLNLSGANLRQADFCERIMTALTDHGLTPDAIALELLESTLVDRGSDIVVQNVRHLNELGFRIMLDDFGTGFASLTHLMKLPVYGIKIDKSFVQSAVQGGAGEKIASAILALAKELGMHAIGEGIETTQQLDYLKRKGCHYGQGYFFTAPVPLTTFDLHLRGRVFGSLNPIKPDQLQANR